VKTVIQAGRVLPLCLACSRVRGLLDLNVGAAKHGIKDFLGSGACLAGMAR
jgi:sulfur relay (sulfurtransferase) complex TusBCD TusD component (DsrE family)